MSNPNSYSSSATEEATENVAQHHQQQRGLDLESSSILNNRR
jgi:hypothetical protein